MKVKTSELTGIALDWAVATCEVPGLDPADETHVRHFNNLRYEHVLHRRFHYSTDWSQGGLIIEREEIGVQCVYTGGKLDCWMAATRPGHDDQKEFGPTPLIAAMRCYVAAKLGRKVEVPDKIVGLVGGTGIEPVAPAV